METWARYAPVKSALSSPHSRGKSVEWKLQNVESLRDLVDKDQVPTRGGNQLNGNLSP
jgi:hypothetical protein